MDPATIAALVSIAGKVIGGGATGSALAGARDNLDFQRALLTGTQANQENNFTDALKFLYANAAQRQQTAENAARTATATRTDQFGNQLEYDPNTNSWFVKYTPEQLDLIQQGQAKQAATNARAAGASSDYEQLRQRLAQAGTPNLDAISSDLLGLTRAARGEGDRLLGTFVQRQDLRQAGNMPVIHTGTLSASPGQRLAEDALNTRKAALSELAARVAANKGEFYDPMAQLEKTANTIEPIDPTGAAIAAQIPDAQKAQLTALQNLVNTFSQKAGEVGGAYNSYGQQLGSTAAAGGRNVNTGQAALTAAAKNFASTVTGGGMGGDISKVLGSIMGGGDSGGTVGPSGGNASGNEGDVYAAATPNATNVAPDTGPNYPMTPDYTWLDTVPNYPSQSRIPKVTSGSEAGYNWKF